MAVDERRLDELIIESQDLQADALRDARATLPDLHDIGRDLARRPADPDRVRAVNASRRRAVRTGGCGLGALAARGLIGTALGSTIAGLVGRPVAAQSEGDLDVQILQTASSLEILAIATYEAALGLPFIADGNPVVKTFAETTRDQHDQHRAAFQDQTDALGGTVQDQPNARYQQVVQDAMPGLTDPAAVVELAATLEEVATDTYLADLALLSNGELRRLMGSVMGVESQHLATLRAVGALLAADPALIALPPDLPALPEAAGSVAFPDPFEGPDMASPPEEGAVA